MIIGLDKIAVLQFIIETPKKDAAAPFWIIISILAVALFVLFLPKNKD